MSLIIPANSAAAAGGFDVDNSCRFDYASSDHVHKTPGSAGSGTKFVFSTWIKRTKLATAMNIIYAQTATNNYERIRFVDTDKIEISGVANGSTAYNFSTNAVYRDPSAWMHLHVIRDSTQGTASNRLKVYVNGVLQTLAQDTALGENYSGLITGANVHRIAVGNGEPLGAYLAEVILLDGQVITPDGNTGEFDDDSGIWKPLDVSELTFGTTGFYLDFEASDNLGNDANGGDDFTEVNLDATNQSIDTCTNNFCTMNALDNFYAAATLVEGNLKVTCNAGNTSFITGTFGLTKGKWYWEGKLTTVGGEEAIGITDIVSTATDNYAGQTANSYSFKGNNGDIRNADENASYGGAYGTSVIGVYMDLDNNKLYFAINGTIQNSGTGVAITAVASTTNGFYFPMVGDVDSDAPVWEVNFGNPVSALSSAVADANGYGSFEYDPSSGTFDSASKDFLAICTKNLATDG